MQQRQSYLLLLPFLFSFSCFAAAERAPERFWWGTPDVGDVAAYIAKDDQVEKLVKFLNKSADSGSLQDQLLGLVYKDSQILSLRGMTAPKNGGDCFVVFFDYVTTPTVSVADMRAAIRRCLQRAYKIEATLRSVPDIDTRLNPLAGSSSSRKDFILMRLAMEPTTLRPVWDGVLGRGVPLGGTLAGTK